jgi:hypothetical protein
MVDRAQAGRPKVGMRYMTRYLSLEAGYKQSGDFECILATSCNIATTIIVMDISADMILLVWPSIWLPIAMHFIELASIPFKYSLLFMQGQMPTGYGLKYAF